MPAAPLLEADRPARAVREDGPEGPLGPGPEQRVVRPGEVVHVQRARLGEARSRQPVELGRSAGAAAGSADWSRCPRRSPASRPGRPAGRPARQPRRTCRKWPSPPAGKAPRSSAGRGQCPRTRRPARRGAPRPRVMPAAPRTRTRVSPASQRVFSMRSAILPALACSVVARGGLPGYVEHTAAVVQLDDAVVGIGVALDVLGRLDPQVEGGEQCRGEQCHGGKAATVRREGGQA